MSLINTLNTLNKLTIFTKIIVVVTMVTMLFVAKTGVASAAICVPEFIPFGELLPSVFFDSQKECESSLVGNKCFSDGDCKSKDPNAPLTVCNENKICALPKTTSNCTVNGQTFADGDCVTGTNTRCADGKTKADLQCALSNDGGVCQYGGQTQDIGECLPGKAYKCGPGGTAVPAPGVCAGDTDISDTGGTVPSPSPSAVPGPESGTCANGAGTINACATFNCPNGDTTGDHQCNVDDQGATFSGWQSGSGCSLPACGQTDYYTEEGNWDSYCGHVFTGNFPDCGSGGGGGGGGSPRPSSGAGPQCVNISADKSSPQLGESVTFTCGQVSQVQSYKFRVVLPNGNFFNLKATGRVSEPFQVKTAGKFKAQCTVCQGKDGKNCTAFEKVANN